MNSIGDLCLGLFPYSRIQDVNLAKGTNRKVDKSGRNRLTDLQTKYSAILWLMRLHAKISTLITWSNKIMVLIKLQMQLRDYVWTEKNHKPKNS